MASQRRRRTGAEVEIDEGGTQNDSSDKVPSKDKAMKACAKLGASFVLCVDIETKAQLEVTKVKSKIHPAKQDQGGSTGSDTGATEMPAQATPASPRNPEQ